MARLIPEDIAEPHQGPWHPAERATLNKLAVVLPDDYTEFHGIHWARIGQARPDMNGDDTWLAKSSYEAE